MRTLIVCSISLCRKFILFERNGLLLITALCLFFSNCTSPSKKVDVKNIDVCEIDIMTNLSNNHIINLSEIAVSIDYCILETNKKCLVSTDMSTYCTNNYIVTIGYIANSGVCYVFDRKSGNFIRQISTMGQGPNEYLEVISSFWDSNNQQVCFWGSNQYLFFNLDGTLSHRTNGRFSPFIGKFIAFKNNYVGYVPNYNGNSTIRIAFNDKTGNYIDSIPNYRSFTRSPDILGVSANGAWLYIYDNNLYFKELSCDTLFQIDESVFHPRYIFNSGGRMVPYELQDFPRRSYSSTLSGIKALDMFENYVLILEILENKKHLYFTVEYRNQLYPAIYNKLDDKLRIMPSVTAPTRQRGEIISFFGFENDLDGGLPFWPQQMISETEMMCVYAAEELLDLDASKIIDENLKNVLSRLAYDSNPVVAIVTLKE